MKTHQKCRKNDSSLKNRGLVPTIKPKPDITYMKFQEILMTGCRGGQKTLKMPPKLFFLPFVTTKIFFKNQALSLLYHYGVLTICKTKTMYTMNPWIGFLRKTNVEKITIILLKIYISTRKVINID